MKTYMTILTLMLIANFVTGQSIEKKIPINDARKQSTLKYDTVTVDRHNGDVYINRVDGSRTTMDGSQTNGLGEVKLYEIHFFRPYKGKLKNYLTNYIGANDEDFNYATYTWQTDSTATVTLQNDATNKKKKLIIDPPNAKGEAAISPRDAADLDSVSFCSHKYKSPNGCKAKIESNWMGAGDLPVTVVNCGGFSLHWIYPNKNNLDSAANHMASDIMNVATMLEKKPIKAFLLGKEVKGYMVTFIVKGDKTLKVKDEKTVRVIAYGVVNNQPVVVRLSLSNTAEPKTNNDIPEFARQILTLTK